MARTIYREVNMFYKKTPILDGGGGDISFSNFSVRDASQADLDAEFADADKTRRELARDEAGDSEILDDPNVNMGNDDDDFEDFDNDDKKVDESDDFNEFDNDDDFDDGREKAYLKKQGLYRKQIQNIDQLSDAYKHLEKRFHAETKKNRRREGANSDRLVPANPGNIQEEVSRIDTLMKTNPMAGTAQMIAVMLDPIKKQLASSERSRLTGGNEFSDEMVDVLDGVVDDYPELDPQAQVLMARGKISEEMADRNRAKDERRGEKRENQRRGAYRESAGSLRIKPASANVGQTIARMKVAGKDHRYMRRYLQQQNLAD